MIPLLCPKMNYVTTSSLGPPTLGELEPEMRSSRTHMKWNSMNSSPKFKKWEELLRANVISTIGNRDHINVCLCYMLYSFFIRQPFNLAYFMTKRMADIPVQGTTAKPYGMLLIRLFGFISPITSTPRGLHLDYSIIPHTFVPLSDRRVYKSQGKHFPTLGYAQL
jgi:hypothetical protein